MADELISRQALIDEINEQRRIGRTSTPKFTLDIGDAMQCIYDAPSVDAVVLPCKVGDTVWLLKQKCKYAGEQNKPWDSCDQYWSNVRRKGMWGCAGRDSEGNTFPCEKKELVWYAHEMEYSLGLYAPNIVLGKNLFLTREEAEAALAERI